MREDGWVITLTSALHIEPGGRFAIWLPAADGEVFGPEPFTEGQGFTVRAGDAVWRAILVRATVAGDGSGVELEVELTDRTPLGYKPPEE